MIDGVVLVPLKQIPDERGKIMHMLRCYDPHFRKFGEIYFSTAYPGVIKGWHVHKKMTLNYAVIRGMIKLVLFDLREDSKTKGELMELFVGEENYKLVQIPPGVANGFKCIGEKMCIVANCPDMPHDPKEMERISLATKKIPYNWDIVFK